MVCQVILNLITRNSNDIIPYLQKGLGQWFGTTKNGKIPSTGLINS